MKHTTKHRLKMASSLAYITAVAVVEYNRHYLIGCGAGIIVIGGAMNCIAVFTNRGVMPVFNWQNMLWTDWSPDHARADAQTRFAWFCDWIVVGYRIMSIGDIIATVGTVTLTIGFVKTFLGK